MNFLSIILRKIISIAACWLFLIAFSFMGCAGHNIAKVRERTFIKTYNSPNRGEWNDVDMVHIIPMVGGNMSILAKDYGAAAKDGYSTTAGSVAAGAVAGGPIGIMVGLASGLGATFGMLLNPPKKDVSVGFGADLKNKVGTWTAQNLFEDLLKSSMSSQDIYLQIELTDLWRQTTDPESPLMDRFNDSKQRDRTNIREHSLALFVLCTIIMEGKSRKSSLYLDLQWYPPDGSIPEYKVNMIRKNYFHQKPFALTEISNFTSEFPNGLGGFYTYKGPAHSKKKWLGNDAQLFKFEVEKGMKVLIEQFKRDIANYCTKVGMS